jgi:hypothetical protein
MTLVEKLSAAAGYVSVALIVGVVVMLLRKMF